MHNGLPVDFRQHQRLAAIGNVRQRVGDRLASLGATGLVVGKKGSSPGWRCG